MEISHNVIWHVTLSATRRRSLSLVFVNTVEFDDRMAMAVTWRRSACYGANLALPSLSMPSIQVKDVPDEVHATLRRRAAAAGMSLQEYLLARLTEDAQTPTLEEVLERAGGRAGGRVPLRAAVTAIRAERDAR